MNNYSLSFLVYILISYLFVFLNLFFYKIKILIICLLFKFMNNLKFEIMKFKPNIK